MGHSDPSPERTLLIVEIVRRETISVEFEGSMRDVWQQRASLMAEHIPEGWSVSRYSAEGVKHV